MVVQLSELELRRIIQEGVREALAAAQAQHKPEGDELIGAREVSRQLGCSTRTLRRMVSTGRLAAVKLGHGGSARLLFRRSDVQSVVNSRG